MKPANPTARRPQAYRMLFWGGGPFGINSVHLTQAVFWIIVTWSRSNTAKNYRGGAEGGGWC